MFDNEIHLFFFATIKWSNLFFVKTMVEFSMYDKQKLIGSKNEWVLWNGFNFKSVPIFSVTISLHSRANLILCSATGIHGFTLFTLHYKGRFNRRAESCNVVIYHFPTLRLTDRSSITGNSYWLILRRKQFKN